MSDTANRPTQPDPASTEGMGPVIPFHGAADEPLPRVPGYEVRALLGRGGMGEVYEALHLGLNRRVALKMILPDRAGAAARARFKTEAEAAARLQHPGIVQVFEVGEYEGRPFLSMEFVPGGGLDRLLRQAALAPRAAAELVERLARAVQAAHAAGVLHRDLKPANVLLAETGSPLQPKVGDFGLAKLVSEEKTGRPEATQAGQVLGTPSYMAPEQARGDKALGVAVDVYGLGAILYECLTGRPPFKGPTTVDTLLQVMSDEPVPPSRLQPRLPRDLEAICLKCLEKDPRRRYASAEELADDLRRFLDGAPTRARPLGVLGRSSRWVRRRPAVAGLVFLVLATAGTGLGLTLAGYREAEAQRRTAEDRAGRLAVALAEQEKARARAEGAEKVALDKQAEAERQLYRAHQAQHAERLGRAVRDIEQGSLNLASDALDRCRFEDRGWEWAHLRQRLPGLLWASGRTGSVRHVATSPDGRFLAVVAAEPRGAILNPRPPTGGVEVWDARTGWRLFAHRDLSHDILAARFSPDGRTLACATGQPSPRAPAPPPLGFPERKPAIEYLGGAVLLLDWRAGGPGRELPTVSPPTAVDFSPDGRRLAGALGHPAAARPGLGHGSGGVVWDAATGRKLASWSAGLDPVLDLRFSPDGARLALATGGIEVQPGLFTSGGVEIRDAASGAVRERLPTGRAHCVCFSPDGEYLAAAGPRRVTVQDAAGREVLGLTVRDEVGPLDFSPDGRRLAIATGRVVQVVHLGSREALTLAGHQGPVAAVAFTPDGGTLVVGCAARGTGLVDEGAEIRLWDVRTERFALALPGHRGEAQPPAYSPDGRHVATADGAGTVRLWEAATGRELARLTLSAGPAALAVSGDGRVAVSRGNGTVFVWDPAGGPEVEFHAHDWRIEQAAFLADGRLVTLSGPEVAVWDETGDLRLAWMPNVSARGSRNLRLSSDGRFLALGEGRHIEVWDVLGGRRLRTLITQEEPLAPGFGVPTALAFSRDGRLLAGAGYVRSGVRRGVRVWEVATGRTVWEWEGDGLVEALAFTPDGRRLVGGSGRVNSGGRFAGGVVRVWDVGSGQELVEIPTATAAPVVGLAIGADGTTATTAARDGTVAVWTVADRGDSLDRGDDLSDPRRLASCVAVRPDGQALAASNGQTTRVWDASGKCLVTLREPREPLDRASGVVQAVRFPPEGPGLLIATSDGHLKLWDGTTPEARPLAKVAGGRLFNAGFSADGRRVVVEMVASRPGAARPLKAFDAATGAEVVPCPDPAPPPRAEAASADGSLRASAHGWLVLSRAGEEERAAWAWHDQEARRAEAEGRWWATAFHLRRLTAAAPADPLPHARLGIALAAAGDWDAAATSLSRAAELEPGHPIILWWLARARLATGDAAGYRRACAALLEHHGTTTDPGRAGLVARTCLLLPGTGDPPALLALAERAAKPNPLDAAAALTHGLALLRAGKAAEAVARLEAFLKRPPPQPNATAGELLLALTHRAAGDPDAARRRLRLGQEWLDAPRWRARAASVVGAAFGGPFAALPAAGGAVVDPLTALIAPADRVELEAWRREAER